MVRRGALLLSLLVLLVCFGRREAQPAPPPPPPPQFKGNAAVSWETRSATNIEFLFRTYHRGEMCSSQPTMYVIEPAPINVCYPADAMSALPHKYGCTVPGGIANYQYNLHRSEYAKTDATCSLAPLAGKNALTVKKDAKCKKDIDSGFYLQTHCGKLDADLVADQLVVKSYTNAQCTSGRSLYGTGIVKASLLNKCAPVFQPPSSGELKDVVAYHRILSAPSAINQPGSAAIVIQEDRYGAQDTHCRHAPIASANVAYDTTVAADGTTTCKADPLQREGAYTYAVLLSAATLPSVVPPYWVLYP